MAAAAAVLKVLGSARAELCLRDVEALWVLVVAAAVAAGYHAARFLKLLCCPGDGDSTRPVAWISFLLDKGCAYVVLACTAAALQACFVALAGVEPLQWSKLCNIYTRFCEQAAVGMVCALAAAVAMALLSAFSARHLFRLYSPSPPQRATQLPNLGSDRRLLTLEPEGDDAQRKHG